MTALAEAQRNVLDNISRRIVDIVPSYQSGTRFKPVVKSDVSDFDEDIGEPRLFDVGHWTQYHVIHAGKSYYRIRCDYPVGIWYPSNTGYINGGIDSDAELISHDFIVNPSLVAGVEARYVLPENTHEIEKLEDDFWVKSTITISVFYCVTAL